jgi:small-conductance mechanosensitive channel
MNARRIPRLVLGLALFAALPGAYHGSVSAQTPTPEPLLAATATETAQALEPERASTPEATAGAERPETVPPPPLEGVIEKRTPIPTATPGIIEQEVAKIALGTGLYKAKLLGLSGTDWLNLLISALLVLIGHLLGAWLLGRLLIPLVERTEISFDDHLLAASGTDLRRLLTILILNYATQRLIFVPALVKTVLSDIYFVVGVILVLHFAWKLVDLAKEWLHTRALAKGKEDKLVPVLPLLARVSRVVLGVAGVASLLSHFGVDITLFVTALGLGGFAISLAARDTIADFISGLIILVDRPFRIGDRIEIQNVGTWGDVVDIGLRTTKIRTRDNRMVIVPNSVLSANQVVNYTYPDPQYRIQTHVGIAYGTDVEVARGVLIDAVRHVEGVLPDRPVDALYIEMGDWAMVFRVRWWIESYVDTRQVIDRVHTALERALDEAGIDCPYPTQSLTVQVEGRLSGSLPKSDPPAL